MQQLFFIAHLLKLLKAKSEHDENFRKFFDISSKIFYVQILPSMKPNDAQLNVVSSTDFLEQSDNHFKKNYNKNSCFAVKEQCGLFALRRFPESM